MVFEGNIEKGLFGKNPEKSFIDKVLARQDVEAIREIIRKPRLSREDMLEALYLISGSESKLLNYGAWDRYIVLKFFVWIREFVKVAEIMYDVRDGIEKELGNKVPPRTEMLLENNERLMEHNVKFLIDLYLNIGRTSLSLGGTGFLEFLKNKYEVVYPNGGNTAAMETAKKPLLGLGR